MTTPVISFMGIGPKWLLLLSLGITLEGRSISMKLQGAFGDRIDSIAEFKTE